VTSNAPRASAPLPKSAPAAPSATSCRATSALRPRRVAAPATFWTQPIESASPGCARPTVRHAGTQLRPRARAANRPSSCRITSASRKPVLRPSTHATQATRSTRTTRHARKQYTTSTTHATQAQLTKSKARPRLISVFHAVPASTVKALPTALVVRSVFLASSASLTLTHEVLTRNTTLVLAHSQAETLLSGPSPSQS